MSYTDNRPNEPASGMPPVQTPPPIVPPMPQQQPWVESAPAPTTFAYPFIVAPGILRGRTSEYRGNVAVGVNDSGIILDGQTVPTAGWYLLARALFGFLLTEYAMRTHKITNIPWGDVETVRLDSTKRRGVLCYHLPNKPKAVFTLGFRIVDPMVFAHLQSIVRSRLPNQVEEGKIKTITTAAIVILCVFAALILLMVIVAASSGGK